MWMSGVFGVRTLDAMNATWGHDLRLAGREFMLTFAVSPDAERQRPRRLIQHFFYLERMMVKAQGMQETTDSKEAFDALLADRAASEIDRIVVAFPIGTDVRVLARHFDELLGTQIWRGTVAGYKVVAPINPIPLSVADPTLCYIQPRLSSYLVVARSSDGVEERVGIERVRKIEKVDADKE